MPTLTDLGYENLSPALRTPVKKPKGRELTERQKTYNALIRGIHAVAERANSLFKTTFKALRRVSLDPGRIGAITKAALVLLQLEHGRTLTGYTTPKTVTRQGSMGRVRLAACACALAQAW